MFFVGLIYIFGIILALWITYRVKNRKIFDYIKNCGELENYPLIGSAHLFVGHEPEDIFRMLVDNGKKISVSPIKIWICNKLLLMVTNPDDAQKILTSPDCIEKGSCYQVFPVSCGLIFSEKKYWKPHRKFLNSTFHISLLKSFFKIFNDVSVQLCHDINLIENRVNFDIKSVVGYRVVDLSLQTAFDVQLSTTTTTKLFANIEKIFKIFGEKLIRYYSTLIWSKVSKFLNIELYDRKLLDKNYMHLTPIIQKTKQDYLVEFEQNGKKPESAEELRNKPEILIKKLTKLTELGYMSEAFMKGHIETMMLAGSDTLLVSVSNILLMLAMEPEVQEKCALELNVVLGDNSDYIDFEQLSKLTYFDRAIKECLRLIPTVPFIVRKTDSDFKLENCTIPNGTDVIISIINMHLDSRLWGEDSMKFNVDNFSPENIARRHPLSYIPFSYGARNCIGYKYATFAMKIMIAHLLLKFKFTTKLKYEDLKFVFGVTLILRNEYLISIENR